jgi:hypothetical protein
MNINLEKYIPELLYNLECVIIPDFGGFVTRTETAAFDEQNMTFRPPFRSISFNKNLVINDGSLIHHIMNAEKITYEQASITIKYAVTKWNSTLNEKNRLELNGIGVFSLFQDQTIQFEPKLDVNFLIESYGLFPVTARPVKSDKSEGIIDLYPKEKIEENNNRKKYLKIAAAIALPLIAISTFGILNHQKTGSVFSATLGFDSHDATYSSANYSTNKFDFIPTTNNPLTIDNNGVSSLPITNDKTIYFSSIKNSVSTSDFSINDQYQIVIGCFAVESNAEKLIKSIKKKGKAAFFAGINNKGLHVVSAGSSDDHDTATTLLKDIQSIHPGAWILNKEM